MVEAEFDGDLAQVEEELKREGKTAADEGKTEDELKAEYRAIAERRVRLGLVLAKLGEQNGITVTDDEINRAIMPRGPASFPARNSRCSISTPKPAGAGRNPRAAVRGQGGGFHRRAGHSRPTARSTARPCSWIPTRRPRNWQIKKADTAEDKKQK